MKNRKIIIALLMVLVLAFTACSKPSGENRLSSESDTTQGNESNSDTYDEEDENEDEDWEDEQEDENGTSVAEPVNEENDAEDNTASYATTEDMIKAFCTSIDTNRGYELAKTLAYTDQLGGECGFRTAASDYEQLCAQYLADYMTDLGLVEVELCPVYVDKWQFNSASLTIAGTDIGIVPASYAQTGTDADGITAEIVNVGDGFEADYEGVDVKGKIVLAGIDQRNVAWIDSYIQEAYLHGAAALVTYSVGGYAMSSDEVRNIQDVCCADLMPTVSISRTEAAAIIEAINAGKTECTLMVDNEIVDNEGISYNVIGRIKGKSSEQQIIYAAHYDKYFYGFQDDCTAVSLILSIAETFIKSGYVPENDIVFVCHGAEEWGSINTQHDWTVGAWDVINFAHPEWADTTIAMFNFELPGFMAEGQTEATINTVPEFVDFVNDFVNKYGTLIDNGTYPNGISAQAGLVSTMEDGISYRFAGVPYFLNGVDFTDEASFAGMNYHTENDNVDTWDAGVFSQNMAIYGAMGIVIDRTPSICLDLNATMKWLKDSLNEDYAAECGYDLTNYKALVDNLMFGFDFYNEGIRYMNEEFWTAEAAEDTEKISQLQLGGMVYNNQVLDSFAMMQDGLIGVEGSWNVVIRHEGYNNTLDILSAAIQACKDGVIFAEDEESGALDILWQLNAANAYSSYVFSAENVAMTTAMYSKNDGTMFWGNNKVTEFVDVDGAIRLLMDENIDDALVLLEEAYSDALEGLYNALTTEEECMKNLK